MKKNETEEAIMAQRYSAPRPTAEDELRKLQNMPNKADNTKQITINPKLPIGREQVQERPDETSPRVYSCRYRAFQEWLGGLDCLCGQAG